MRSSLTVMWGFISVGYFSSGVYFLSKIKCVFFPWFCSEIGKAKYCLISESIQVKIQPLADGGMVLGLGFHYQVCDVNSMYVFTADLCSLIRRGGIFAFKESQVQNLLIINTINFYSLSADCVSKNSIELQWTYRNGRQNFMEWGYNV